MLKGASKILIIVIITVMLGIGGYAFFYKGEFEVEFGDSIEARG